MERGKMTSTGRGGKSKAPQHPQDIFALGSKSTVVVNRDSEKRNIHKPSTSGVERKRETTGFGSQPPTKRSRIGSPAEAVGGTSLEVDPVDLVPNVLQALDTHNSDKLLGLLTGSIRLLKSQRSKPDPILCMSMLYLTKIRPNMFAHETVTQSLCTLLKREQGAAFKSKGNPLVFVLACNMLYAGHKDSNNWPDTFIKVYIEDALNERWWVECSWCKCLVENIVTAFSTKHPPPFLIPSDNTLGTMSPSGSGSPLMGSTDEDPDNTELEYTVFPSFEDVFYVSWNTDNTLAVQMIKENRKFKITGHTTERAAEQLAILKACEFIATQDSSAFIISDSLSSLIELQNPSSYNRLTVQTFQHIHNIESGGRYVSFIWVKAHVGIFGNELADQTAKKAALSNMQPSFKNFPISYIKQIKHKELAIAKQKLYEEPQNCIYTKKLFPSYSNLTSFLAKIPVSFQTTQLLTGHGYNKQYLHRFHITPDPFCPCDSTSPQTFEHLLYLCPRFQSTRTDLNILCSMHNLNIKNLNDIATKNDTSELFLKHLFYIIKNLKKFNNT
ncbi:hypothetical protein evm_000665 [Chilo suppressalis]|nr:hypothetical protein evm_000665 [Chilo suppressalis]